ncbi:uncharacterized protein [Miscanthus floridulus]|uniref:uncharacterized protein isoform X3 n=1 Tax=Miscanthus floridulus TaxID=154761 RepID=UPI00345B08F3
MRLEASYAAKELADIHGIIGPVFHKVRPPISLCRFRDEPSIYQGCPACLGGGACPGRGRGPWKQHQHLSLVATHQQQMGELQACADKAVKMVHQAHESIKDVHELFTLQVPPEDIEELSTSITGLLTSTRSHCTAVDQALETFRQHEVCEARDEVCRSIYAGFDK